MNARLLRDTHHGDGRFGTLILISTIECEGVVACTSPGVSHCYALIIVTVEPPLANHHALTPDGIARQVIGGRTSIDKRCDFDGLLIEGR